MRRSAKLKQEAIVRVPVQADLLAPSPARTAHPLTIWSWWTLLSLDAPTVALCWHLLFRQVLHIAIPATTTLALITTVWLIYVTDRLLDTRTPLPHISRHRFYLQHRRALTSAAVPGAALLAWCATQIPSAVYMAIAPLIGLALVHFAVVHRFSARLQRLWPKELIVGSVFALGVTLPVIALAPGKLPRLWPYLAVFASLCWCNCVAIEHWEWRRSSGGPVPNLWAMVLGPRLKWMAALIAIATLLLPPTFRGCQAALLTSTALLAGLDFFQDTASLDTLRVLADAALLTPALFLFG